MKKLAVHVPVIPTHMCREIGRIITRWAYLENYTQRTVWMVMGISREEGRLAVREVRLSERPLLIADLMHVYGLKADEGLVKALTTDIERVVEFRDLVAHGAWSYSEDHRLWQVTVTKGSWNDQNLPKTERKKKINPEGLLANVAALRRTVGEIDVIINNATRLHEALAEQLAALREKPPEPSRGVPHLRAQRPPTP